MTVHGLSKNLSEEGMAALRAVRRAVNQMTDCGTCMECCLGYSQGEGPHMVEVDDEHFAAEETGRDGKRRLKVLANGACIHANLAGGCTVHNWKDQQPPLTCQTYPFTTARIDGWLNVVLLPSCAHAHRIMERFSDPNDREAQDAFDVIVGTLPGLLSETGLGYSDPSWRVLVKLQPR